MTPLPGVAPVRVGTALYYLGPLVCPRCGWRVLRYEEAYGILRMRCERTVESARGWCRATWTAVRLPPGCTGRQLSDVIGPVAARAVLESVDPRNTQCSDMELQAIGLPGGTQEAIYIQRAPDTPEPLMGWRQAQQIMNALMGTDDDTERQGAA